MPAVERRLHFAVHDHAVVERRHEFNARTRNGPLDVGLQFFEIVFNRHLDSCNHRAGFVERIKGR